MNVSLMITCLADLFYPEVGESVVKVLNRLGVKVQFPAEQTCCGQPAFNDGFWDEARGLARRTIEIFEGSEAVVIPSGSCAAMLKVHYLTLFENDPVMFSRVAALAERSWEFSEYLTEALQVTDVGASYAGRLTYHASCHLLRGLGVNGKVENLLRAVRGAEVTPLAESDRCCGFGGAFSVKHAEISAAMMRRKMEKITATGADAVVSCDAGCLMQMAGGLQRTGQPIECKHLAEILAHGMTDAENAGETSSPSGDGAAGS